MWKFINTILLVFCFCFGAAESILFGDMMDIQWGRDDFLLAPLVFGAMCFLSIWSCRIFSKDSKWYTTSYNMNLFANDNPLKFPFALGGLFAVLGLGGGAADIYQSREISNIAIMLLFSGIGVFATGFISVKVFSHETI